ncbi:glycerate kinase [Ornithinibacillus xuwenensis]|uniref:Glycerate kinase n=1 Tax=Ornithinibacillus xuwenensis TaxID=3144668 RepID=A0ABU9XIN8_9BACI
MKIVVAPDSYKGSLSSIQVADIMCKAIAELTPEANVISMPMADGGESALDAMLIATQGKRINLTCTGPLGSSIKSEYAIVDGHTAIIECASIAGLPQVPVELRNPDHTTSFGIGEVMKDALDKNCKEIVVGLGGSAVNDGGLGMLQALGVQMLDQNGKKVGHFGRDIHNIVALDFSNLDFRLDHIKLSVACDVNNPLCGEKGATYVYGPQKGATSSQLELYDHSLQQYGELVERSVHKNIMEHPGAGAAGGLGFALLSIGAELVSGAELLANAVNMEEAMKEADLVFTGEGQSDEQTLYGKAPGFVAALARKQHIPTVLISGSLSGNLEVLRNRFSGCFSIVNKPLSLEECIESAEELLFEQMKQIMQLINDIKVK